MFKILSNALFPATRTSEPKTKFDWDQRFLTEKRNHAIADFYWLHPNRDLW